MTTNTAPKPRAGKAKDNLYRDTLDDDGIRILARAADRIGLADETQMLRVYVHKAMVKKDTPEVLKLMPMLARIEEARIRIDANRPDANPNLALVEAIHGFVEELKTVTNQQNRI